MTLCGLLQFKIWEFWVCVFHCGNVLWIGMWIPVLLWMYGWFTMSYCDVLRCVTHIRLEVIRCRLITFGRNRLGVEIGLRSDIIMDSIAFLLNSSGFLKTPTIIIQSGFIFHWLNDDQYNINYSTKDESTSHIQGPEYKQKQCSISIPSVSYQNLTEYLFCIFTHYKFAHTFPRILFSFNWELK